MSEPTDSAHCERCGHPLDAELGGVCPVCALDDAAAAPASPEEDFGAAQLMLDDVPLEGATHARLGNYELREPLGAGGMGVVYKAWQTDLERWVAIKLLPIGSLGMPEARERFRQEALTLAKLRHPNIVSIHDFSERDGQAYLVMEYVEGANLEGRSSECLEAPEKAAACVKAAAEGMQAAHEAGVLHRDLKPSNLLLGADGRVRITDFGTARPIAGQSDLTGPGVLLGTLAYLAPEQLKGGAQTASVRSDVYSLGAVLYRLLTGRAPFVAASPAGVLQQVTRADPPPLTLLNPLVPRDLALICSKCLRKDPRDRYGSARELAEDLGRFLANREIKARPLSCIKRMRRWGQLNPGPATAVLLGAVVVATLGVIGALTLEKQVAAVRARIDAARELAHREELRAYAQQLDEARSAFAANDPDRAQKALDATRTELRGWEYRFLDRPHTGGHRSWQAHEQGVSCLAANADGTRIVSGDWGGNLRVWDADAGRVLLRRRLHPDRIRSVQFSPDGRQLVTGSEVGTICVVDVETGMVLEWIGTQARLNQAAFFGKAGDVLTVNDRGRLELWCAGNRGPPTVVMWRLPGLLALDIHARSEAYACGDAKGRIHVGLVAKETETSADPPEPESSPIAKRTWQAHAAEVMSVAWSPDGAHLASASADGQVRLWNPASGDLARSLRERGGGVRCLAWSADGRSLAAATDDGVLLHWRLEGSAEAQVLSGHQGPIFAVAFLGQQHRLVSGGSDRHLRVWDPSSIAVGETFRKVHASGTIRVRFAHRESWFVAAGPEGELWRQDAETGETNWTVQSTRGRMGGLALTTDDAFVVSGGRAGRIEVRSSTNGALVREFTVGTFPIRALDEHPGGRLVAAGGDDRVVQLLDVESGTVSVQFPVQTARIGRIAFSPDGEYVLSCGPDQRLVAWPIRVTNALAATRVPTAVMDFDVGSGGIVTTIGRQEGAQTWLLPGMKPIARMENIETGFRAVVFAHEGQRLLASDDSGVLRCWDARTGIQLLQLPLPLPGRAVRDLQMSPNDGRLALVGSGGELYLLP